MSSLPQGKMRYEVVKRNFLLCFLVLTTLFLAWSLFFTGEKMEKLIYAREGEKLYAPISTIKQNKGRVFDLAKLMASVVPQPPPPAPAGNTGSHP
ncbi:hypothetical protein ACB092_04G210600 [Castanea dentata]